MSDATWLPNLVGGTSIWKLAVDLNEAKFFDGRLLVPETEGSESLPVTVRWDLTGLVPLKEARANPSQAEDAANATREFSACLERVAKVFATPNSGFDKYKEAFTVPSLDADENYFYSPSQKKLFVINWGASPRAMGGKAEYVFGYEDWGKQWGDPNAPGPAAPAAAAAVAAVAAPAAAVAATEAKKDEPKKDEKDDKKGRPWWIWPLFGLAVIALILLALFLLKACDEQKNIPTADAAPDALAEGASSADGSAGGTDGAASGGTDGGGDGGAAGDASADAAGADAASKDGGGDGGKDGGHSGTGDDDDDDDGTLTLSSGGASSGGGGGGGGSSGGKVTVKVGPGGGAKTPVHRKHYSDDAVKWRVTNGTQKVSRTEDAGKRFDVWLTPGQTFEGVKVEWQDKAGKWHPH